jgi:hypothetical protein
MLIGCEERSLVAILLRTGILIGFLVNNLPPTPQVFSEVRILKDFKSNEFVSADSKGVMGAFCGSADSKRLRGKRAVNSEQRPMEKRAGKI